MVEDNGQSIFCALALKYLVKDKETLSLIINSVTDEMIGDGPKGEGWHIRTLVEEAMIHYMPYAKKIWEEEQQRVLGNKKGEN